MEFLKRMKSREIVEMSLKTIAAVLVGLILIILMEGMIFNIYMNKINEKKESTYANSNCVAYCEVVEGKEDEFKVYLHDTENGSWQVRMINQTEAQIESSDYKEIVWHAPTPFDVSINGVHYIVMAGFIVAILGLYGWRFYKLDKEYKGFEKKFKKTGKIFA